MPKPVLTAPIAKISKKTLTKFNHNRIDPYYWLKDKNDAQVIDYLTAENVYTEQVMASTKALQQQLYEEILGRIKEDDESYPTLVDGYYYYSRTETGKDYPIYLRKKASPIATEEIIFDVNEMAQGNEVFIFADYEISPDNKLAAFLYNTTGSYAEYILKIKDLTSNKELDFCINGVSSVAWAADNQTLFYSQIDETLRSDKVFRRKINEASASLIYHEKDATFSVGVGTSKNKQFIMMDTGSITSSETYLIPANQPMEQFKLFLPRQKDVEYAVHTHSQQFYLYYKDKQNLNGKLYLVPLQNYSDQSCWKLIIAHDDKVYLGGVDVLNEHLLIQQKINGLNQIKVLDLAGKLIKQINFPEQVYQASLRGNPEMKASTFRYSYSSLNRPGTLFEYDIVSDSTIKLKQTEIPSGFNPEHYQVERIWATAQDSVKVPMALVYKKSLVKNGSNPTLLYGYGSYGSNTEAYFRSSFYSLIDRGFVFAIAQIRGGSELGEQWYEDGKFLNKKNTFNDFIACAEQLINQGYTNNTKLAIMGGSAGGLLMGAVINQKPELFNTVVAQVPFVDVLTTMLDDSLPLTAGEYEEWGNPNQQDYYNYMLSYSPYDNIKAQDYPNILVTAGINDSQVLFHEPAKWVAKLRTTKTDHNLLLLKTNMESGHGGATGKYASIKELAFELAFVLNQVDRIKDK